MVLIQYLYEEADVSGGCEKGLSGPCHVEVQALCLPQWETAVMFMDVYQEDKVY